MPRRTRRLKGGKSTLTSGIKKVVEGSKNTTQGVDNSETPRAIKAALSKAEDPLE